MIQNKIHKKELCILSLKNHKLILQSLMEFDDNNIIPLQCNVEIFDAEEHRWVSWLLITDYKMLEDISDLHLPLDNKVFMYTNAFASIEI